MWKQKRKTLKKKNLFLVIAGVLLFVGLFAVLALGPIGSGSPSSPAPPGPGVPNVAIPDAPGNSGLSDLPSGDTIPPTTPGNFAAVAASSSIVSLSWSKSTDNVAVKGYRIYRNNLAVRNLTPTTTLFWDDVTPGTTYTYAIAAYDSAGLESTRSNPVSVNVPTTDTTPPTVSITSPANAGTVEGRTTITVNAVDNRGVLYVVFQVDGVTIGTSYYGPSYEFDWFTLNTANGTHDLSAIAYDTSYNPSTPSYITVFVENPTDAGGAYCGDGTCQIGEDNSNCPADCPIGGGGGNGCSSDLDCSGGYICNANGQCEPPAQT